MGNSLLTSDSDINTALQPYEYARRLSIMKKNRHVLIIDDQSTGRAILEQIIQQIATNIIVHAFETPQEALIWLETNDADLIVTDYRMPEMNGVQFIHQVRHKEQHQNVPIMMITVVSEKEVRHEALEAGATAFLTRPIDQIECRTSCRNLLQMHEQQLIIQDRADWLARQVEIATSQIIAREKETIIRFINTFRL